MTARRGRRIAAIACAVACCAVMTSGCRLANLSFRTDKRVEIVSPEFRATVKLPFDVRWTVKDFDLTGPGGPVSDDSGFFGVLLDVTPMPPGEGLTYFARDDETCKPSLGCPDAQYLADRRVYTTQATTFDVDTLADTRPTDRPSAPDDHDITIVLLNANGERIGETAFRVKVIVDRGVE